MHYIIIYLLFVLLNKSKYKIELYSKKTLINVPEYTIKLLKYTLKILPLQSTSPNKLCYFHIMLLAFVFLFCFLFIRVKQHESISFIHYSLSFQIVKMALCLKRAEQKSAKQWLKKAKVFSVLTTGSVRGEVLMLDVLRYSMLDSGYC